MRKITVIVLMVLAAYFISGCEDNFQIREVSPNTGIMAGGEPVFILGSGFDSRMGFTVYFGNSKAENVIVNSSDKLTVTTPPAEEALGVDIRIMTDGGKQYILKKAFQYIEKGAMDIRELGKRTSQRQKTE